MTKTDSVYQQLSHIECLELLTSQSFGRIAVLDDGRPLIFPVNYVADGDTVVFRSDIGTKLSAAVLGPVAFEIDGIDEDAQTGWSVIVQGVGHELIAAHDARSARLHQLDLEPWVPGDKVRWVEVRADSISGRKVRDRKSFESPWFER
jgi:nitroimidazol reductase NimA-like FMN-containing flavoprotein (pyridoxamine 5'-phosphate oxidase superfamily)